MEKNLPANAEDARNIGSTPKSRRPAGEEEYSCLENSMDREAWWTTVHGVTTESDTAKHAGTTTTVFYDTNSKTNGRYFALGNEMPRQAVRPPPCGALGCSEGTHTLGRGRR